MKRKAILIGNTNGLPGVKIDIKKFSSFLKSDTGGAWREDEIEIFENPRKSTLINRVTLAKLESFDYVNILFSGHGGYVRRTILEINESGETIDETLLQRIAPRQLNIHDCCRSISTQISESKTMDSSEIIRKAFSTVRQRFDSRIMQAIPQQALLYSCSVGQVSYDTADGGVYLSNLLSKARQIETGYLYKTVGVAHQESIEPTKAYSKANNRNEQVPDAVLAKCLTQQQLILSIQP